MIKKILILAILGGLGYVGYLVWQNLTPKEKDVVAKKAGDVVDGAKDLASKAADKLTGAAKEGIAKMDADDKQKAAAKGDDEDGDEDDEKKDAPAEKPPE